MTKQELDELIEFIEVKHDIPPRYLGEIEEYLEKSQFSKDQAMAIFLLADNIANARVIAHEDHGSWHRDKG